MLQNGNHRAISRSQMGGAKFIHTLPRADRALVLASLMQEAPAKRESEVKCAFYAFRKAVEGDDPSRAYKIFERHKLGESGKAEEIRDIVSKRIDVLKAQEKNERADSFAILFFREENAISKFSSWAAANIQLAKDKMGKGDYPFTYVLLNGVLNAEEKLGLSIHSREAAALLAVHYLRGKDFKKAEEGIRKAAKTGILSTEEKNLLIKEIGNFLSSTSESHVREVAGIAREDQFLLFLCQEAISARISESINSPNDLEGQKMNFGFAYAFQMHAEVAKFGRILSAALLGKADAEPEKFYHDYLHAARIAGMAGAHDIMGESIVKFLKNCEKLGKNDPAVYAEGSEAAQEFSFWDQANSLGGKAFFGFISKGEYEKARQLAEGMSSGSSAVWGVGALLRNLEQANKRLV